MNGIEKLKIALLEHIDDLAVEYYPTDQDGTHCVTKIQAPNELAYLRFKSDFNKVAKGKYTLNVTSQHLLARGGLVVLADINQV